MINEKQRVIIALRGPDPFLVPKLLIVHQDSPKNRLPLLSKRDFDKGFYKVKDH